MKMARGGTNICVPCSTTPRGQAQCRDVLGTEGYRESRTIVPRWKRARAAWLAKPSPPPNKGAA